MPESLMFPASAAQMADHLKCRLDRVQAALHRMKLQPVRVFGNIRVFERDAFKTVVRELERIGNKVGRPRTTRSAISELAGAH